QKAGSTSLHDRSLDPGSQRVRATPSTRSHMFRTLVVAIVTSACLATAPALALAQSKPSGQSAAKPAVTGTININTPSVAELQRLRGIGGRTAGRVIEYRQKNGPFKKVEELMNVRGIGEKNFLKLKNQITVGAPKAEHAALQPQQ